MSICKIFKNIFSAINHSSLYSSIILRISSISFLLNLFLFVNAVKKSGRNPPKFSCINCSPCAARNSSLLIRDVTIPFWFIKILLSQSRFNIVYIVDFFQLNLSSHNFCSSLERTGSCSHIILANFCSISPNLNCSTFIPPSFIWSNIIRLSYSLTLLDRFVNIKSIKYNVLSYITKT